MRRRKNIRKPLSRPSEKFRSGYLDAIAWVQACQGRDVRTARDFIGTMHDGEWQDVTYGLTALCCGLLHVASEKLGVSAETILAAAAEKARSE